MKINSWEELKNFFEKGEGFVYNDFGSFSEWNQKEFNKLHKASCPHLKQMTLGSVEWTHWFSSLKEAESWLESNRKYDGYSYCKSCLKSEI